MEPAGPLHLAVQRTAADIVIVRTRYTRSHSRSGGADRRIVIAFTVQSAMAVLNARRHTHAWRPESLMITVTTIRF